jgi:Tol biopolymer transport system component
VFAIVLSERPDDVTLLTVPQGDAVRSSMSLPSAAVSADGRFVAFTSRSRLASLDTDDEADVYVLDRRTQEVALESLHTDGHPFDGECAGPRLSGDGRYLVFEVTSRSEASGPFQSDVVVRDRFAGHSRRIREKPSGLTWSGSPDVSADGRVVVFTSSETVLVPGADQNGTGPDVYRLRPGSPGIDRVSIDTRGSQPSAGVSSSPRVSADGRYIVFVSTADFDAWRRPQTSRAPQPRPLVYVRDTSLGVTRLVSAAPNGAEANAASRTPGVSGDGRYIVFVSEATNLVPQDRNRSADVFLYDAERRSMSLVSRSAAGGSANGSSANPAISSDGRFIVFQSDASDLICARRCAPEVEDVNLLPDVFLLDRATDTMTLVSTAAGGVWMEESGGPAIDASGAIVAFTSRHPIDTRDIAHDFDLFVRVTLR